MSAMAVTEYPMVQVTVNVNGSPRTIVVEPRTTLADALRGGCGLTGTRVGCDEGVCGSCTVLVDGEPVRACMMFAAQAHGASVRTIESVDDDGMLHPLQKAFWDHHAVGCGFCTPGLIMLALGALERDPDLSEEALTEILSANQCRCNGYLGLVKAVKAAQVEMKIKAGAPR